MEFKMLVVVQVVFGNATLIACGLFHIWIISRLIPYLALKIHRQGDRPAAHAFSLSATAFSVLLLSHTVQLFLWATIVWELGALPNYERSVYFALVTYTTVGYGDVTLGEEYQIFGSFAAMAGIVTIGLSTALMVGLFTRLFGKQSN